MIGVSNCPFCNKAPVGHKAPGEVMFYKCDTRGCTMKNHNMLQLNTWNTRPLESALEQENAMLRARVERLEKVREKADKLSRHITISYEKSPKMFPTVLLNSWLTKTLKDCEEKDS